MFNIFIKFRVVIYSTAIALVFLSSCTTSLTIQDMERSKEIIKKANKLNSGSFNKNNLPPSDYNLRLESPVADWYEGIPLGNGMLGALIWGHQNKLVVKLDRLDLWDERCNPEFVSPEFNWKTLKNQIESGKFERIGEIYDKHYHQEPPTHIAVGKLLIDLPTGENAKLFELNLAQAEAVVQYQSGRVAKAVASATEPVIMMLLPGRLEKFSLWAPGDSSDWFPSLGYPKPTIKEDNNSCWYEQVIPEAAITYDGRKIPSWKFVTYAQRKVVGDKTLIAITITTSQKDGADPLTAAKNRTNKAISLGYDKLMREHASYWAKFYGTSSLSIPDKEILQHYYLTRYYLGASSSPGYPAMATLQSIWTDQLMIPRFKNNLHNDLETQVQYQSYQIAGNFAEGRIFFEYLWDLLPRFRFYAKSYYGVSGAAVPGVMSLAGAPLGGWSQNAMSPTFAGWFGWLFYQHWRYTQDMEFLKNRAYPWCTEIAECWLGLLKEDEKGVLKLPLSSSAEIFNNSPRAWLKPNSNQDIDLMRTHLLSLAEMATILNKNKEATRWRTIAQKLGPNHLDSAHVLMWDEVEKVVESHRHFSQTMSIYPFNLLTKDGPEREQQIISATMKQYDKLGHDTRGASGNIWAEWSWPWMSSIRSRAGDAEAAYKYLDVFVKGFITRNGFHNNADINGVLGKKQAPGGLFTIEGNMLANRAVQDMLIQSWAPGLGTGEAGIIRLFPATPWAWHDASFADLRAEGGFRISARREKNATVWFRIIAGANGLLRLRDNFEGRSPKWKGTGMTRVGLNFERQMQKGEIIEATMEVPKEQREVPDNVYTPIKPNLRN